MWKTKKMITGIMENFNFDTVVKIMDVMNWEWHWEDGLHRPTLEEIKWRVESNLKELCIEAKVTDEYKCLSIWWFEYEVDVKDGKVDNITVKFIPLEREEFRSDYSKELI